MSYASVSINHPGCRCDLEAKELTCHKENNIRRRFYGCANFISKDQPGCFFQWFSKEMKDKLFMRIEKIERSIGIVSKKIDELLKNLKFILWVIVVVVIVKFNII